MIVVDQPDALIDQPIAISLRGFTARRQVSVTATLTHAEALAIARHVRQRRQRRRPIFPRTKPDAERTGCVGELAVLTQHLRHNGNAIAPDVAHR